MAHRMLSAKQSSRVFWVDGSSLGYGDGQLKAGVGHDLGLDVPCVGGHGAALLAVRVVAVPARDIICYLTQASQDVCCSGCVLSLNMSSSACTQRSAWHSRRVPGCAVVSSIRRCFEQ